MRCARYGILSVRAHDRVGHVEGALHDGDGAVASCGVGLGILQPVLEHASGLGQIAADGDGPLAANVHGAVAGDRAVKRGGVERACGRALGRDRWGRERGERVVIEVEVDGGADGTGHGCGHARGGGPVQVLVNRHGLIHDHGFAHARVFVPVFVAAPLIVAVHANVTTPVIVAVVVFGDVDVFVDVNLLAAVRRRRRRWRLLDHRQLDRLHQPPRRAITRAAAQPHRPDDREMHGQRQQPCRGPTHVPPIGSAQPRARCPTTPSPEPEPRS